MRIAHIIMAHKNPEQLHRLIKRLKHPNFDFYIHLDKKVNIEEFIFLNQISGVQFIKKRITCNWGGWNFTKAIIQSMSEVVKSTKKYDFVNLISAQDYPVCSADDISKYFEDKIGQNFLHLENPDSDWSNQALHRYEKFHFTDINLPAKYFFQRIINSFGFKRKMPDNMKFYGGSNSSWWTISFDSASYIVDKLLNNQKINNFFKYSWGSDEFVIATVLMNSEFNQKTISNNLRYIDWSEGGAHPKFLLTEDLNKIINSKMLFARKFDIKLDSNILDELDKNTFAD